MNPYQSPEPTDDTSNLNDALAYAGSIALAAFYAVGSGAYTAAAWETCHGRPRHGCDGPYWVATFAAGAVALAVGAYLWAKSARL